MKIRIYNAIFEKAGEIISIATFKARNIKEARRLANQHKHMTSEIKKAGKVKTILKPAGY